MKTSPASHPPYSHIGLFADEKDAARAYDAELERRGQPAVNAPILAGLALSANTSAYFGVSWSKPRGSNVTGRWLAQLVIDGKEVYVCHAATAASTPLSPHPAHTA